MPASPKSILENLHTRCGLVLADSLRAENDFVLGQSYVFLGDLDLWASVLKVHAESVLYETATHEYAGSMLNVCQGQYRNAFKSLRLVLELCLQGVHLSSNLVVRGEWLNGESDTIWALLVDADSGPLSQRFCKAFFPELSGHASNFREMAKAVYRELSECIHGNRPNHIPLSSDLTFNRDTFLLWSEKAKIVRLIILFVFTARYLKFTTDTEKTLIEAALLDQLGHIEAIRVLFGGVATS